MQHLNLNNMLYQESIVFTCFIRKALFPHKLSAKHSFKMFYRGDRGRLQLSSSCFSSSGPGMRDLQVSSLGDVTDLLLNSFHVELQLSKSGPEMPKVPAVSRNFIANITGISLKSVAPFYWSLDPRVISRTDKYFALGLATLSKTSNKDFSAHVHCKPETTGRTGCFRRSGARIALKRQSRRVQAQWLLRVMGPWMWNRGSL